MIDAQGRLFGKINVIDLSVILGIIFIISLFIFGKIIFKDKTSFIDPGERFIMELDCLFVKLKPEVAEMMQVGDKEMLGGYAIAEIVELGEIEPCKYEIEYLDRAVVKREYPAFRQRRAKLRLRIGPFSDTLCYKKIPISPHYPLQFFTSKYKATGLIIR